MHLLASKPGGFVDDDGIVDLAQTPASIIILSAADSSLASLAQASEALPKDFPSIRLANWMQLLKPAAFDLYENSVLESESAQVVIVSLLGGKSYWPYGVERLQEWYAQKPGKRQIIIVPGDHEQDLSLMQSSSVSLATAQWVWDYLREGGRFNAQQLLQFIAVKYLHYRGGFQPPKRLPKCLIYPAADSTLESATAWLDKGQSQGLDTSSLCLLLFYRSHYLSGNTAVFDELVTQLELAGICVLPLVVVSLKDPESLLLINHIVDSLPVKLILNTTGFSCHRASGEGGSTTPHGFQSPINGDLPILQLMMSASTEQDWQDTMQGLRSRDIATQIVLPEMDGRIITRAVSFKTETAYNERCQVPIVRYQLHKERAQFVAQLARNYLRLSLKSNGDKRIALILANYPTKDGRIGNGVGLDTPVSTVNILQAMSRAGFPVDNVPVSGNDLLEQLLGNITNNPNTLDFKGCWQSLDLETYWQHFKQLPAQSQADVLERWGEPERDPKFRAGRLMIAGLRLGETFIGIQPARGFNLDLLANYHDPDLVPPHSYLAFYFWLRHEYKVQAVIHVGKHGNLEWLPGKGTALAETCWPDILLGPLPHFYPFIVNDPGEGAQAKRRSQAVIIDHLMPPMTRAETYGGLATLEGLVDEYYQAVDMDQRRASWLRDKIIQEIKTQNVITELAPTQSTDDNELLEQLDAYLCDIKEAQIRHGLHRLGQLPNRPKLVDTLVALLRLPRGKKSHEEGILHAFAKDFGFQDFDPLAADTSIWSQSKPELLNGLLENDWRTTADTRERLEKLAQLSVQYFLFEELVTNIELPPIAQFPSAHAVLNYAKTELVPALEKSAVDELGSLIKGLQGQFVEPGPSGAPTRGRLDTLPTGRNFFSVDNRSIPSTAAWALGQLSAQQLINRHLQEQGDFPRQLGLSVWGTATMRTGGDDIAQAFALMGVKPVWAAGSQRVVDIEVIPAMLLGRPRVDVTLRVSGFFRDAFPNVMRLFDTAVELLAELDEPGDDNTIREHIEIRVAQLEQQGIDRELARRQASYRVFGSKPGAYGAGLQGLIDERCWQNSSDLAEAYRNWGGYAYGRETMKGVLARSSFEYQLSQLDTVVQNQDNREHDLLDSDDYYQFQGGMANAVSVYGEQAPSIYHLDHSNPAAPRVRTLKEELNRVIRSRVLNPKWLAAMQEHGYKGAFEMAASVDYLFAYSATTQLIDDYQYENVCDTLILDPSNQQFLRDNNINALEEMAERMLEAIQRGLWQDAGEYREKLQALLLDLDDHMETASQP